MKFRVQIPAAHAPAASGASIYVYQAGTTVLVPSIYDASGNVLANPYVHPGGDIVFHLVNQAMVQVGVKPAGAAAPVIATIVPRLEKLWTYTFQKSGAAAQWVLT